MKPLGTDDRDVLVAILAETRRVEAIDLATIPANSSLWPDSLLEVEHLTGGLGVRIRGDWIGDSPADRVQRQRVLRRLEAHGLVRLAARYDRHTTHVDLTIPGRKAAEALEAEQLPAQAALPAGPTRSDRPEPRQIGRGERPTRQNANAAVSVGTGSPEGVLS